MKREDLRQLEVRGCRRIKSDHSGRTEVEKFGRCEFEDAEVQMRLVGDHATLTY
jgi:hypothetical protein